jgi:hypothetical protein
MRPKRGLDQNDKTNQTPVNEKSGNSESKSKSEEEAEFIPPHFSHTHSHGSLSQFEQGQTHGSL